MARKLSEAAEKRESFIYLTFTKVFDLWEVWKKIYTLGPNLIRNFLSTTVLLEGKKKNVNRIWKKGKG